MRPIMSLRGGEAFCVCGVGRGLERDCRNFDTKVAKQPLIGQAKKKADWNIIPFTGSRVQQQTSSADILFLPSLPPIEDGDILKMISQVDFSKLTLQNITRQIPP